MRYEAHVEKDIAGPRFSWSLEDSENRLEIVEMYGGEWQRVVDAMGEDRCWHRTKEQRLTIGQAIDLVGAADVARAQLVYAPHRAGLKGALVRALRQRGLCLA